jgi:hypothetical protein
VKRHGEAVGMLNRTILQIDALPTASRENYERWIPAWWNAVVGPNHKWDRSDNGPLIDDSHLSLLHTVGDVIESKLEGSSAAPGGAHVDELAAEVNRWLADLKSDPSILPDAGLLRIITEHLEHVVWLIEHRTLFGDAPVAAAAQQAFGAIAAATPAVDKDKAGTWTDRARSLLAALALYNGLLISGGVAIEQTVDGFMGVIHTTETVVDHVTD